MTPTRVQVTCQRADITVYIPTTCMFEDTLLRVEVERGNIAVSNMTTNFDTLSFFNENGIIAADDLSGVRTLETLNPKP